MTNDIVPSTPARADNSLIENRMAGLAGTRQMFATSFDTSDKAGQIKLLGAINDAEPIDEHLDEVINLTDFVAQVVEFVDEAGEMQEGIRVVIIDDEGNSYAAMSEGILKSLQTFVSVLGDPSGWEEPLPIKIVRVKSRRGFQFFTAKLA